ncbi:hypothetical protein SAMN04487954_10877 [Billgrantia gudaonensis]|uniref:Uncharacterized protein n=1 Tax=Billgrantia gudaonensis TaxID=376427 RepID=A0A1G8WPT7_9GAMM|nr:hypothetical protein SAMN04487954_10877 [Halomonas gudaonensis]
MTAPQRTGVARAKPDPVDASRDYGSARWFLGSHRTGAILAQAISGLYPTRKPPQCLPSTYTGTERSCMISPVSRL